MGTHGIHRREQAAGAGRRSARRIANLIIIALMGCRQTGEIAGNDNHDVDYAAEIKPEEHREPQKPLWR